ncbi:MAG: tetratricopeptide repeat protein [Pirellulaceae bacterium]
MIQRTLNIRVLAVTALVAIVAGGTIFVAHGWQVKRTARVFLTHADAREQAEKWLETADYLDRYLRLLPGDDAVRIRLAEAYGEGAETLSQKRQAVQLYYRALGTGAGAKEFVLRQRLAELLAETGRFVEAEQEARQVLAHDGEDARAHRALAIALWNQLADGSLAGQRTRQIGVAKSILEAQRRSPADVDAAMIAAALYREQPAVVVAEYPQLTEPERRQRADAALDKLVADAPQEHRAWLARHRYRELYKLPGADEDLQQALALAPQDPATVMTAAQYAFRRGQQLAREPEKEAESKAQFAKAKDYYASFALAKSVPLTPEWHLGLGAAQLELDELEAALATWRKGLEHFEQPTTQTRFYAQIAGALLADDRLDEARQPLDALDKILNGLDASVPRDMRLALQRSQDLRRVSWQIRTGKPLPAVGLLRHVIANLGRIDAQSDAPLRAWLMLGQAYSALGQWLDSASAYDRACTIQPRYAAAHASGANAWLLAGRADLASQRAEEAIALEPTLGVWFVLAVAQLELQSQRPLDEQDWKRVEQAVAVLQRATPAELGDSSWRLAVLRADYSIAKATGSGNREFGVSEALGTLREAEAKHPDSQAFWTQLMLYYEHLKAADQADRALAHLKSLPDSAGAAAVATAKLASVRGEFDRAVEILQTARKSLANKDQDQLRAELVNVALTKRDFPLARALVTAQHQEAPGDLAVLRRLAEIELENRNFAALEVWEQKLNALRPAGQPLAGYYRAWRLMLTAVEGDEEQLRAALQEQTKVAALRPSWAEAASLRGMIEQQLGRFEAAVVAYEQAIQLGERRTVIYEQLIALLDQLNRPADCEKYLTRMAAQLPLSQRLTELAGAHQIKGDRPAEAVALSRQGVELRPNDALARVWLGRLLLVTGEPALAETEFLKAIELAPRDVRCWNGLFSFYLRTNALEQARATLDKLVAAVELQPAERSFVLAQGHELLGDAEQAARHYREADRLSPTSIGVQLRLAGLLLRSDPRQAEASLRKALQIDAESAPARRMLAVLLASRGGEDDLREVERLLGKASDNDAIAGEDQRLRALLLAQRGGSSNLTRAVALLEPLVERGVGSGSGDRLILAQLYENLGRLSANKADIAARFESARQQILLVAARPEADPAHVAAFVGFLLRHDRRDEAAIWLSKLERTLSSQPRDNPEALAQFLRLCLDHGAVSFNKEWWQRLAKVETKPLRLLALEARHMAATEEQADVPALIESRAEQIVAKAKDEPEKLRLFRGLGDVCASAGLPQAAESWYRQLVAADPQQYHLVAGSLAKQGRFDDAIAFCEQAAKTDVSAQSAIVIAAILVDNSPGPADFQRAEPVLAKALQDFGTDVRLLYSLGVLRVLQNRYDESIVLFRKVIELDPQNVPAINNLALLLADNAASRQEALALIDKAIDISGMEADLLDTKGAILVYDGQSAAAVSLLEAAASSASSDPRYSFHLAAAYHDVGKTTEAKTELQAALSRQLESQVLTPTDRRLLDDLKSALVPKAVDR